MFQSPCRLAARAAWLALATLVALATTGCRQREAAGEDGAAALMRNLVRAGRVDIEVSEPALEEPMARAAALVRGTRVSGAQGASAALEGLEYFVCIKGAPADASAARMVVGTPASVAARALAARIGVQSQFGNTRTGFRYADQEFAEPSDALIATFEDPERPGLPVTLVLGNDAERLARRVHDLAPGWKPWIRVFRGGSLMLSGPLWPSGQGVPGAMRRVGLERLVAESGIEPLARPPIGFVVRASRELSAMGIDAYLARCAAARAHVAQWASPDEPAPTTSVVLHARVESFALAGGHSGLGVFDPASGQVDAWIVDGAHDGGASVAESAACAILSDAAEPWMIEAAGVDAAWTWFGRPLDRWITRLVAAGRVLPVSQLTDPRTAEEVSAHILGPLRGALWRYLRETHGDRFARELWRNTRALEATADLDARFRAWLDARVAPLLREVEGRRAMRRDAVLKQPFLKGVGVAEPQPEARVGYASQAFLDSLAIARASGANAVMLTSYCVDEPGLAPLAGGSRALGAEEGDARLFAAVRLASASGMRTMLEPHLLSGPAGTWSGSWTRRDEPDWKRFFERYARFVEHYALLGELAGCDVLSLGSNLGQVTREKSTGRRAVAEEERWKRDGWHQVVGAARGGFAGLVTYSASRLEEADKLGFWNELDALGLELFPSMESTDPSSGRSAREEIAFALTNELDQAARIAQRVGKPLLITQAGFDPSLSGAAAALGRGSASAEWQAQEIAVLGECLRQARPGTTILGVFAWRWSSDPNDPGASAHDCVIAHPSAREALRGVFQRL